MTGKYYLHWQLLHIILSSKFIKNKVRTEMSNISETGIQDFTFVTIISNYIKKKTICKHVL